jgi:hypothetical protein
MYSRGNWNVSTMPEHVGKGRSPLRIRLLLPQLLTVNLGAILDGINLGKPLCCAVVPAFDVKSVVHGEQIGCILT